MSLKDRSVLFCIFKDLAQRRCKNIDPPVAGGPDTHIVPLRLVNKMVGSLGYPSQSVKNEAVWRIPCWRLVKRVDDGGMAF